MIVIRNVFHCKPGQAKNLVKLMKQTFGQGGLPSARVMTDLTGSNWTVVLEVEAESLEQWEKQFSATATTEARRPMEGYMDLVTGGHREIYKIE